VAGNPVTRANGCRSFAATSVNSKWEIVAGFRYYAVRADTLMKQTRRCREGSGKSSSEREGSCWRMSKTGENDLAFFRVVSSRRRR
jgi:hypothetical protein